MKAANAVARGRRPVACALAGLGALGLAVLVGGRREAAGAILAAWLILVALPAGALPIVAALERFGLRVHDRGEGELSRALRRLLALMPVAAFLAVPVLFVAGLLHSWPHEAAAARTPLALIWFTPPFFVLRTVAYLAAWIWLAGRFGRPGHEAGDGRTISGIGLHAVIGTLAVGDWIGALDHRLGSSLQGLLVMTAWSGLAFAAAILLAPEEPTPIGRGRTTAGRDRLVPLVVLLSLWAFLHFVQFLIVWSANLPQEVLWYLARGGWLGRSLAVAGGSIVLLGALATLRPGRPTTRILAGAVLALHGCEMFWFVTPALRDRFVMSWTDLLAALGIGSLAMALLPLAAGLMPLRLIGHGRPV